MKTAINRHHRVELFACHFRKCVQNKGDESTFLSSLESASALPSALPSALLTFYFHSTMGDPLSATTGIISLIALAVKLVVGAAGLIDKTTAAHREVADELQDLQRDLDRLHRQIGQIRDKLQFLATDTKDRALKKLLQE